MRRVHDTGLGLQFCMRDKCCLDARLVAIKNETQTRVALKRQGGARHDYLWPVISAHGIECYRLGARHMSVLALDDLKVSPRFCGTLFIPRRDPPENGGPKRVDHSRFALRDNPNSPHYGRLPHDAIIPYP